MGTSLIIDVVYGLRGDKYVAVADEYGSSLEDAAKSHILSLLMEWFPIRMVLPNLSFLLQTYLVYSNTRPKLVSRYEAGHGLESEHQRYEVHAFQGRPVCHGRCSNLI